MNLPKKIILACGAVATAAVLPAQPATRGSNGLLGQRYAEVSVGQSDPHGTSDNGFVGDAGVNLPIAPNIDVGFGYNYSRINLGNRFYTLKDRTHTLSASSTYYVPMSGVKPFAGAALGYQWVRERFSFGGPLFHDRDDEAVWALGIGVEVPVGSVTITPTVAYQDGFHSRSASGFTYGAQAHMWFTPVLGGFVGATYSDPTGGGTQSWIYKIGARLRF